MRQRLVQPAHHPRHVLGDVEAWLRNLGRHVAGELAQRERLLGAATTNFEVLLDPAQLLRSQRSVGKADQLRFTRALFVAHDSFSNFCFSILSAWCTRERKVDSPVPTMAVIWSYG